MVHITFCINSKFSEGSAEPRIIKEEHYWISDDPEHEHYFQRYWQWLHAKGFVQESIGFSMTATQVNSSLVDQCSLLQGI